VLLAACGGPARDAPAPGARGGRTPVVLVSLDGFRWDYLDRGLTPNLSRLAREGVRAEAMVPVFPTKTFPNHYTIVTGRYPAHHGILGNVFTAPDVGATFSLRNSASLVDARFYLAEPLWVSAERQGLRTAPLFWPGSGALINGVRPTYHLPFDDAMKDTARVRQLGDWLRESSERRPTFLTLYWSGVDNAGHEYGPDAPETNLAIAQADSLVGRLATELSSAAGGAINLIIVSDHGMVSTGPDRVIWLNDYLAEDAMRTDEMSALLTGWPAAGLEDSVVRALRRAPYLTVYRKSELPERFQLRDGPRIPPLVAVAEPGWTIARRTAKDPSPEIILGNHGYDDSVAAMRAIFIAHGPAFRRGVVVPPFRNIHVYPLLAELAGVRPEPSDGSIDSVGALLAADERR
jgi:predicted AlkP superfamily pyrophosphatase or phosphodiesterase